MRRRILITHGRSRMSYVAAKSLHKAGFDVFVSDASPVNMTRSSRFVAGFDRTPDAFGAPLAYVERLAHIVTKRNIDILLPGHEDVFSIQKYADRLPSNLLVAAPPYAALCAAGDKLGIVRVAESAGVAAPLTVAIRDLAELKQAAGQLSFPLIVKPRYGSGGKEVRLVHSVAELVSEYTRIVQTYQWAQEMWPVLQEYIPDGQLFGVCFLAKEGRVKACFTERYLRCKQNSFGTSVLRERCDWKMLADAAEKIVAGLQWTGIGHLDFIANPSTSQPYLLEMNPRWWGALNLAVANGYDFPLGLVSMLLDGEPVSSAFCEIRPARRSLWIVGELVACQSEVMQGKLFAPLASLRRTLFPGRNTIYDDFSWSDPLPLLAETLQYLGRFLSESKK